MDKWDHVLWTILATAAFLVAAAFAALLFAAAYDILVKGS